MVVKPNKILLHLLCCLFCSLWQPVLSKEDKQVFCEQQSSSALMARSLRLTPADIEVAIKNQLGPQGVAKATATKSSILLFQTIGYTLTGAIYAFLGPGVQSRILNALFSPDSVVFHVVRWWKNLGVSYVIRFLSNSILYPEATAKAFRDDPYIETIFDDQNALNVMASFVSDTVFALVGYGIYWAIGRWRRNQSIFIQGRQFQQDFNEVDINNNYEKILRSFHKI